jgi:Biotin carboxylase, N-terminal domain
MVWLGAVSRGVASLGWHHRQVATTTTMRVAAKALVGRCNNKNFFSSTSTIAASQNDCNARRRPFEKVLIANRGEIVSRVIRTCRSLDIPTVAIYSTGDNELAPFVRDADEAICIGPSMAAQSYLNANKVLAAIQQSGATAVHPGYGM